jgi:hypothetical protein
MSYAHMIMLVWKAGSPIKGRVKRKNTSPLKKIFLDTLTLFVET